MRSKRTYYAAVRGYTRAQDLLFLFPSAAERDAWVARSSIDDPTKPGYRTAVTLATARRIFGREVVP